MKAKLLLLISAFILNGCTGYTWSESYGWGQNGAWNKRKCSTHCATIEEDSGRCIAYHEDVQPYCDVWYGK